MRLLATLFALSTGLGPSFLAQEAAPSAEEAAPEAPAGRWWKGNLDAHSLWGAGDAAPEHCLDWYRSHDYDFALLGDLPASGERWVPVTEDGPLTDERVLALKRRFGAELVRVRETDAGREMRLATFPELAARFDQPDRFLVVPGLEHSFAYEDRTLDLLALGTAERLDVERAPEGLDTIRAFVSALDEHGAARGASVLAVLQRPNFTWSGRLAEMVDAPDGFALEIQSGHPASRQEGDLHHWSTSYLWFQANSLRIPRYGFRPLGAFGGDDARHWFDDGADLATPGRVWIQVRAKDLTTDALVDALAQRDFYVTNGPELSDVSCTPQRMRVDVVPPTDGREVLVRFLGSRRMPEGHVIPDQALFETQENPAIYFPVGDELYVRAEILHTRLPGEGPETPWKQAWTQAYEPYE